MPHVEGVAAAARNLAAIQAQPDVRAFMEPEQAEMKAQEDADDQRCGERPEGDAEMDARLVRIAAAFDGNAKLHQAIAASGMSTVDYLRTTVALSLAAMAHTMGKEARVAHTPNPDPVREAKARFVAANEARVTAVLQEVQKTGSGIGAGDGE